MLQIMTDTGTDFTLDQEEQLGILIRPIHISFGKEEVPQRNQEDILAFYERLGKEPVLPTTSQLSLGELMEDFQSILADLGPEDQLLYICLSSKLSMTYERALQAKEELGDDRLFVFDSKSGTYGQDMEVIRALEKREEGWDARAIMQDLEAFNQHTLTTLMLGTLTNLKKGGRIPGPLASFGNALSIKPNVIKSPAGYVEILSINRGKKASLKKQIDIYRTHPRNENYRPAVLYSSDRAGAEAYQEEIWKFLGMDTDLVQLSPVIGTHIGLEALGLCGVFQDPISELFPDIYKKWRE